MLFLAGSSWCFYSEIVLPGNRRRLIMGARLKRAVDVLGVITHEGPQSVTQVSHALNLPMSSTHDLCKAMVLSGLLEQTERGYDIGASAVRLSFKIQKRFDLAKIAAPELQRLVNRVGFDVYLAIRTGNQVSYGARFRGRQRINISVPLGLPLYCHATAAGKLFAAYDREIRREVLASPLPRLTERTRTDPQVLEREFSSIKLRGMSITNEEAMSGIIGIATPIRSTNETLIGAVHVSAPASSLTEGRLEEVCRELEEAAASIERLVAGKRPAPELVDIGA
jgi:DNA-binding IclR family transcriptional regulator